MKKTIVNSQDELNIPSFSWQMSLYEILHDALVSSANELLPKEKADIEWKDYDMICDHTISSGLLDNILMSIKSKVINSNQN